MTFTTNVEVKLLLFKMKMESKDESFKLLSGHYMPLVGCTVLFQYFSNLKLHNLTFSSWHFSNSG